MKAPMTIPRFKCTRPACMFMANALLSLLTLMSVNPITAQDSNQGWNLPAEAPAQLAWLPEREAATVTETKDLHPTAELTVHVKGAPEPRMDPLTVMEVKPYPLILTRAKDQKPPRELDCKLYTDRYQGMADYFEPRFFFLLGPEIQNELYYYIVGKKGLGVYHSFLDERLISVCIITHTWKMIVHLDKEGKVRRIVRKQRSQKHHDYSDFTTIVSSVKNCSMTE